MTSWLVASPEVAAEAIWEVGPGGVAERYVPRFFAIAAFIRILWPALARRLLKGGMGKRFVTSTGADAADRAGSESDARPDR
jgi:hypothetical protein